MKNIWKNLIFYFDGLLSIFMAIYAFAGPCVDYISSFYFMREMRGLFLEKSLDSYLKVAFVLLFDQTYASTFKKTL